MEQRRHKKILYTQKGHQKVSQSKLETILPNTAFLLQIASFLGGGQKTL